MNTPFIAVFRPHQRPAWATAYHSEADFEDAYDRGDFDRSCFARNNVEAVGFEAAWEDVGHDLHALTRLESAEEVRAYLDRACHNQGSSAVIRAAEEIGWLLPTPNDEE